MNEFLTFLTLPPVHMVLLAMPILFVVRNKNIHRIMTDKFASAFHHLLPVMVAIAVVVSMVHPLRFAMGAAIMSSYTQWLALRALYHRFERAHGRPPRVAGESDQLGSSIEDLGFRAAANITVVGLPLVIDGALIWFVTDGHGVV